MATGVAVAARASCSPEWLAWPTVPEVILSESIVRAKRRAAFALSLILRAFVWSVVMKSFLIVLAMVTAPMLVACTHEVAHEESTHKNIFGQTTHESTSVQKNDVTGDVQTQHEKVRY
jgi:hypothetical protein